MMDEIQGQRRAANTIDVENQLPLIRAAAVALLFRLENGREKG